MFSLSSSDDFLKVSQEESLSFPILKWEECDTLGKKIDFLAKQGINFSLNMSSKVIKAVVLPVLRSIERITRCCLRVIFNCSKFVLKEIGKLATKAIKAVWNTDLCQSAVRLADRYVFTPLVNFVKTLGQCFASNTPKSRRAGTTGRVNNIFSSIINRVKTLANWTIVPLYNYVLSPGFKFINRTILTPALRLTTTCVKKVFHAAKATVKFTAKTLANWTVVPLYNHVLIPGLKLVNHKILNPVLRLTNTCVKGIFNIVKPVVKPLVNWTIVPLYKHVLAPTARFVGDIFQGLFFGEVNKTQKSTTQLTSEVTSEETQILEKVKKNNLEKNSDDYDLFFGEGDEESEEINQEPIRPDLSYKETPEVDPRIYGEIEIPYTGTATFTVETVTFPAGSFTAEQLHGPFGALAPSGGSSFK